MATLAEIRTWVRTQTLVDVDEVSNAEVLVLLNQGIRLLAASRRWPFLETSATITTVADQASYSLPADFSRVEAVYYADRSLMRETTRRRAIELHGTDSTTYPSEFYFWQGKIFFAPAPSTGSQSITLDYQTIPQVLSSDVDEPQWHSAHHMVIAEYAAGKLWEREEDLEKTSYHLGAFYAGIKDLGEFYDTRSSDMPVIIGGDRPRSRTPWDWQRD